jgi:multidrug efflux system membrane fusion protein
LEGDKKEYDVVTEETKRGSNPERAQFLAMPRWVWIILLVVLLGAVAYASFPKSEKTRSLAAKKVPAPPTGVPVAVAAVKNADFSFYLTGLGSVTPLNTVVVKSRVDGQLMEVLFQEGQMVNRDDLLIKIDSRPFEAQLAQAQATLERDTSQVQQVQATLARDLAQVQQAEANVAKDVAQSKYAEEQVRRYAYLVQKDYVPKEQYDLMRSNADALAASIQADKAAVENARATVQADRAAVENAKATVRASAAAVENSKIQLNYCRITSPITGRVGLRLVDPGNIVRATDPTGLLVITQLQPITVVFPIPEDSLPLVLGKLKKGERLTVEAYDREQKHRLAQGYLKTADNQIDPNTGTVRLKAVFPNEENELFPNQFVNARLLMDVRREATIVPASAIQRGPKGAFVYIVTADQTVTMRPITIDEIQGGEASVKTGLKTGELVVVDGAERLREGTRVEVKSPGGGPAGEASQ